MVPSETKKFRADAPPLGACENIVGCSQTGGQFANGRGNLVDTTFEGFLEQSRLRIMHELRRCSEVDTHEAVQIGELEKNSEVSNVVGPKFNRKFPRRGGPGRGGRTDISRR